jgi:hypothetical protein
MKKTIRLTESDLVNLIKKVISEETNASGTSVKNQMVDLLRELKKISKGWTTADDLMEIYKKMIPFKGKMVQPNDPFKYKIVNWGLKPGTEGTYNDSKYALDGPEEKKIFERPMLALKFMDLISKYEMWDPKTNKFVYGANPHGFLWSDFIGSTLNSKFGLLGGGEDRTSDGKYTISQLKKMIFQLVGKES